MNLTPKEVKCSCGHSFETDRKADYCSKCGQKIFYDDQLNRRHRLSRYYFGTIVLVVATFLVYLYIELIATPLLQP